MENNKKKSPKMTIDIMDFFRSALAKWKIILVVMVLFGILGVIVTPKNAEPLFESKTQVIVYGTGSATNYAVTLQGDSVLEEVKSNIGFDGSLADLRNCIDVAVDEYNEKLIYLTAKADNSDYAEKLVVALRNASEEKLNEIIDNELTSYIDNRGNERVLTQGDVNGVDYVEAIEGVSTTDLTVPAGNLFIGAIVFMALGLIICLVIIFFLFIYNEAKIPVRYPDDIEKYFELEAIAVIPADKKINKKNSIFKSLKKNPKDKEDSVVEVEDVKDVKAVEVKEKIEIKTEETVKEATMPEYCYSVTKACGMLRRAFYSFDEDENVISFVRTGNPENKVDVAFATAQNIAKSGSRVLFIDTAMNKSDIKGLSELVNDFENSKDYIIKTSFREPDIITAGLNADDSVILENIEILIRLIENVKVKYDFVILSTMNAVEHSEAYDIASLSDHAVIIMEEGKISVKLADRIIDQVNRYGLLTKGVVISEVNTKTNGYYGRYFYDFK